MIRGRPVILYFSRAYQKQTSLLSRRNPFGLVDAPSVSWYLGSEPGGLLAIAPFGLPRSRRWAERLSPS